MLKHIGLLIYSCLRKPGRGSVHDVQWRELDRDEAGAERSLVIVVTEDGIYEVEIKRVK